MITGMPPVWRQPMLSAHRNLIRINTRRTLIAAPKANSGPLMQYRSDRELPPARQKNMFLRTLPLWLLSMAVCSLAIFNYQKSNSSVVASTLFALRKHPEARAILGDEIYFAQQIPWIWGTISQLQGHVDISFGVKGTKGKGMMRFRSERPSKKGFFKTLEWTLQPDGGEVISLLDSNEVDPMADI